MDSLLAVAWGWNYLRTLTFSQNKITHYYSSTELLTVARNENRQGNPKKITKIEFGIMQGRYTGDIEYLQASDH